MEKGHVSLASKIYEVVGKVKPDSILDIGIGHGLWGALVRNYYGGNDRGSIYPLSGPVIHGIEMYPRYRNPMWELYNQVLIGDISKHMHVLHEYDLVIASNILEHVTKDTGKAILTRPGNVICGVSRIDIPALWAEKELMKLGFTVTTQSAAYFVAWKATPA